MKNVRRLSMMPNISLPIEEIEKNPESFIYDYFAEIIRQVDLRREQIKSTVYSCSDEINKSIECSKESCLRLSKNGKRIDVHKQKKGLMNY